MRKKLGESWREGLSWWRKGESTNGVQECGDAHLARKRRQVPMQRMAGYGGQERGVKQKQPRAQQGLSVPLGVDPERQVELAHSGSTE